MPNNDNNNRYAGMYQLFMLGLCIYVLLALGVDTFFK